MTASVSAHDIDSLYNVFLTSRGENAVRLANEIVTMAGDSAVFSNDTPVEVVNDKLLKTLIFWHFDRSEMMEVISYTNTSVTVKAVAYTQSQVYIMFDYWWYENGAGRKDTHVVHIDLYESNLCQGSGT